MYEREVSSPCCMECSQQVMLVSWNVQPPAARGSTQIWASLPGDLGPNVARHWSLSGALERPDSFVVRDCTVTPNVRRDPLEDCLLHVSTDKDEFVQGEERSQGFSLSSSR